MSLSLYLYISLSLYLSISLYLSLSLSLYLSLYLSLSISLCLSACLPAWLVVCLSVCLFTCLSASLKTKLFCETSSVFELDNVKNAAIQRDFFNFWHLTTSKTKQVCEISSFFKIDNIKNEAILRDFLQTWKVECRADGLVPMRFAIFRFHLSKLLRLPRKKRKSAPGPPNSSDEHVSCTAPATENASSQILFKCPTLAIVF